MKSETLASRKDIDDIHSRLPNFVIHEQVNDLKGEMTDYVKNSEITLINNEVELIKKNFSRYVNNDEYMKRL